jgi:hypothetical protein
MRRRGSAGGRGYDPEHIPGRHCRPGRRDHSRARPVDGLKGRRARELILVWPLAVALLGMLAWPGSRNLLDRLFTSGLVTGRTLAAVGRNPGPDPGSLAYGNRARHLQVCVYRLQGRCAPAPAL